MHRLRLKQAVPTEKEKKKKASISRKSVNTHVEFRYASNHKESNDCDLGKRMRMP